MMRYGFHGGLPEMKSTILFAMRMVKDYVTLENMHEMMLIDERMDYFTFCHCVDELTADGLLLREVLENGMPVYTITPKGYEVGAIVEPEVPASLRRAVRRSIYVVINRLRKESNCETEMFTKEGETWIRLILRDETVSMLNLELMVGNRKYAQEVCDNFKQNAEEIYSHVLNAVLRDYKETEADTECG